MRCQSAALKTSSIELSAMSYENVKKPKNRKRKSSMRLRKWFAMELSLSKTQWLTLGIPRNRFWRSDARP